MDRATAPWSVGIASRVRVAAAILIGTALPLFATWMRAEGAIESGFLSADALVHLEQTARASPVFRAVHRYESAAKLLPLGESVGFVRSDPAQPAAFDFLYLACARLALAPRRVVTGPEPNRVLLDVTPSTDLEAAAARLQMPIQRIVAPGLAILGGSGAPASRR